MVRKRIGDMLREEAKEPVAREELPVTAETDDTEQENGEGNEQLQPINISATNKISTELETAVDELKNLLQTAQKTETSLQAQIADLKSQLQEQKKLTKELQTQASHDEQLKTQLEEAKETILKLAEVSSKPTAKVSAAKKQSNLVPAKSTRTEKLPNYSDPSERPNTTIANKDIGWFD
jgi:predicted RNase H-like nuclease (RuvC/YqgF family)